MHPQPRVRFVVGVCTRVFTAEAPDTSGIPHAMVLTAYFALSPGTGLSCPRRSRDKPATLTPASGRQDHTPLPSASSAFVSHAISVHRIPLPTSVTIAIRPSCGGGMAGRIHSFRFSERQIFLHGELTTQISLNPLRKLDFARNEFRACGPHARRKSSQNASPDCPSGDSVNVRQMCPVRYELLCETLLTSLAQPDFDSAIRSSIPPAPTRP